MHHVKIPAGGTSRRNEVSAGRWARSSKCLCKVPVQLADLPDVFVGGNIFRHADLQRLVAQDPCRAGLKVELLQVPLHTEVLSALVSILGNIWVVEQRRVLVDGPLLLRDAEDILLLAWSFHGEALAGAEQRTEEVWALREDVVLEGRRQHGRQHGEARAHDRPARRPCERLAELLPGEDLVEARPALESTLKADLHSSIPPREILLLRRGQPPHAHDQASLEEGGLEVVGRDVDTEADRVWWHRRAGIILRGCPRRDLQGARWAATGDDRAVRPLGDRGQLHAGSLDLLDLKNELDALCAVQLTLDSPLQPRPYQAEAQGQAEDQLDHPQQHQPDLAVDRLIIEVLPPQQAPGDVGELHGKQHEEQILHAKLQSLPSW
eukprot:scaffold2008_cov283-Pinguiococcus_pyrenoidosus.AAC.17